MATTDFGCNKIKKRREKSLRRFQTFAGTAKPNTNFIDNRTGVGGSK